MIESLVVDLHEGVQTISLNRPEKLNAFTDEMLLELGRLFGAAARDESVKVVILTGAGRAFCAGADVSTLGSLGGPPSQAAPEAGGLGELVRVRLNPVILRIASIEKPVLAAVNGVAAGAGMSLALACDLRIAGSSTRFVSAFVQVGLVPDGGSTHFLPRFLGQGRTLELAWTGAPVLADEALARGMVNRIVDDAQVLAVTQELGARLAAGPSKTLALIKRAIRCPQQGSLERDLEREASYQEVACRTADFAEGVQAFLARRAPRFSGR